VAQKFTDRPNPPQGAFSSREHRGEPVLPRRPAAEQTPPVADEGSTVTPRPQAYEEMVLDDIEANPGERTPSSLPPPLGHSEGHDAWTVDRLSRQSTVPPVRRDDVDRLRELSALPFGDLASEIRGDQPIEFIGDKPIELRSMPLEIRSEMPLDGRGGGALDLVDRSRPSQQLDIVGEMEELYALDDLTGALRQAEFILGRYPDHEQALRCANNCRSRLIQLYMSKLGPMNQTVTQALDVSQVRWLGLDHRSGFLLSRVDGVSTVEEVLDICGMPRLEALKTLAELLERGAIRLD
jgi:hypothetical protein